MKYMDQAFVTLLTRITLSFHFITRKLIVTYWQEEQLEGEDVPLLAVARSNLPELTACLKGLLDALLHIAVDLMPEGSLQEQLPAPVVT